MYKLPPTIYTKSQLRQLQTELNQLSSLRTAKNIVLSANLQDLATHNGLKDLNTALVKKLLTFVESTLQKAPEISLSLASLPNVEERGELVSWLRGKFNAQLMLHIIIQPELLAGCMLRTDSNVYDWSLRTALESNQEKLVARLAHV